jgi:RsiW-degrading membrane proteinase PrsW (M82 family)
MSELIRMPVSLVPVLVYLGALVVLDSFKLVAFGSVLRSIFVGAVAAGLCLLANNRLIEALAIDPRLYARTTAPVLEEIVKAAYLIALIRFHRVGFAVDAAIHGFAVGAGFAFVENVYYLRTLEGAVTSVWMVRGFGTATLHGSATAILAIWTKTLVDRHGAKAWWPYVPGLLAATTLHTLFNQMPLPQMAATVVIVLVFPLAVAWVFARSERATRAWLGSGFDADVQVLEIVESGEFRESRIARYLESLRHRFPPAVVADMLCLLRVHHELAIRAKSILLAREAGVEVPVGEEVRTKLAELEYLERSVGKTGQLALAPLLTARGRERWQLSLLGK